MYFKYDKNLNIAIHMKHTNHVNHLHIMVENVYKILEFVKNWSIVRIEIITTKTIKSKTRKTQLGPVAFHASSISWRNTIHQSSYVTLVAMFCHFCEQVQCEGWPWQALINFMCCRQKTRIPCS